MLMLWWKTLSNRNPTRLRLYDNSGEPSHSFNRRIINWLSCRSRIVEHQPPKAFASTLSSYNRMHAALMKQKALPRHKAHRMLLSNLTDLLMGIDLNRELEKRLSKELIHDGGIRTTIAQGVMKNTGENFVNLVVYAMADCLKHQDDILVDKGPPPLIKDALTLRKQFAGTREKRDIHIPIEVDFCVFSRTNRFSAIVGSAKTRLKEVFHIGTMWKLLFDISCDASCLKKWGLQSGAESNDMLYVFATSDSIREGGRRSQGPDIKITGVRNLIAADASFFDYVFVSKPGIPYVSGRLNHSAGRESLFHELGCLIDLVEQKYEKMGFSFFSS